MSERRAGRPVTPLIDVPDDGLGPAMLALTPAQRAFVTAKVTFGVTNTDAARAAGYSAASRQSLEVQGSRLAHNERVQAAILEEGQKLARSEGPKSITTLRDIRDNRKEKAADRIRAATELLNRSGFTAVTQHNVEVTHNEHDGMSRRELASYIIGLCRKSGLPETEARKLLGTSFVDAEFTEGEPAPVISPEEAAKRERENELRRQREAMSPDELAAHKTHMVEERRERLKAKRALHEGRRGLEEILAPAEEEGSQ